MKYKILGTTIKNLLDNNILEIPNYIKIDVDGIEHLILEGGNKFLSNRKIKSISIEVNENFKVQYDNVLKIMKEFEFKIDLIEFEQSVSNRYDKFEIINQDNSSFFIELFISLSACIV